MYFRDCKTLSVFERKIPLTLEFRFQPRLFIDSLPYLKKNQKDHKELRSAARLDQAIVIKA
jgi:hypothetical protein